MLGYALHQGGTGVVQGLDQRDNVVRHGHERLAVLTVLQQLLEILYADAVLLFCQGCDQRRPLVGLEPSHHVGEDHVLLFPWDADVHHRCRVQVAQVQPWRPLNPALVAWRRRPAGVDDQPFAQAGDVDQPGPTLAVGEGVLALGVKDQHADAAPSLELAGLNRRRPCSRAMPPSSLTCTL